MNGAERQKRYRERRRAGRMVIAMEIDHVSVAEALVAAGLLDFESYDDPLAIAAALERAELAVVGVTHNATPSPVVLRLANLLRGRAR